MSSNRRQPATVPPATAMRTLPPAPLRIFPLAETVVIVSVVVALAPDASGILALPNEPSTFSVLGPEAVKLTVPVYPPVDVIVIVEVPVFPGFGDEMVMAVAVTVMLGLVTVTVVVPEEGALKLSPP
jgi:hypothetical protein